MAADSDIDAVVIGAGAVGLASARALARAGHETVILERHGAIGTEVSARNSEVIHAGIYYPKGSLKARLCVEGRGRLYDYLESHKLPHRRCGKLIVATDEGQLGELGGIAQRARANGVEDIRELTKREALALEPALNTEAALLSPSTGILDAHSYMLSLEGEFEDAGGMIAFHSTATRVTRDGGGFLVHVESTEAMRLRARIVVNAGGLWAPALAARVDGLDAVHVPEAYFAKGNYFSLTGRAPFSHLIYPVPEAAGLGVHLTLDMGGQARFGPDVEWIEVKDGAEPDYAVNPARGDAFYASVRRYWPGLKDGALQPAYSGVRPKLNGAGEAAADFVMSGPEAHGVPGLVNLFGIESPGLTASLAIAERVKAMVKE
ncbi:NAD(P)/FAD-dependent oxidoreductase [Parvibaculum sp.]|uniref:NAD(P)/FAD-dependent oxidoreductase n=1 Tax=Parvibaculum sp. TaxID=2024848 RepID=UPI001B0E8ED0|nr:NAD(P)/FAD-dependent oxidoreductase [Parvibaculum sp.]MBO6634099.1 NAD(P)/FAD-dependent oxidoreductase [Parvibaculum sp.]MBO6679847.1 NAD(P)/FAD-dependent oxidoreductase [Parvibaculum sp.]MBO6683792.1 NAD(P)/FAD-dependent oxidoreductase [Parvibaculum sp.]